MRPPRDRRAVPRAIVSCLVVAGLVGTALPGGAVRGRERHRPVLAFYYPWYGAPVVSGQWRHWTEGGHDPDHIDPGTRSRDIGATDHPRPDVYDSNDPRLLRRQLEEARQARIDGFVVSWWGRGTFEDQAFARLMDAADHTHSKIHLTIYYEVTPNFDPGAAVADLTYILEKYGTRRSFLHLDGRPVIFVYGRAIFPAVSCATERCPPNPPAAIDWKPILTAVRARFPVLVFGDRLSTIVDLTPVLEAMGFDGVHLYNPNFDLSRVTPDAEYASVVSSAHATGLKSATTIIPGYDDTHIGRANPTVRPREGGSLYRNLWRSATRSSPDVFLITSFNEWHEGTEIEPSHEYGQLYLTLTRQQARQAK